MVRMVKKSLFDQKHNMSTIGDDFTITILQNNYINIWNHVDEIERRY